MKILIIGGTRFIGPQILKQCSNGEHEVTVFNRNTRSDFVYPDNVKLIRGDRNNKRDCASISQSYFDVIIDMCAYNSQHIHTIQNIIGNSKKYIFISTGAVYKARVNYLAKESDLVTLDAHNTDYVNNKIIAERKIQSLSQKWSNIEFLILRPAYVLGRENPFYREQYFFDRILQDKVLSIPPHSNHRNSFVDVRDLADLIYKCIDHPVSSNLTVLNVANSTPVTFSDFAKRCSNILGRTCKIEYASEPNQFPFPYEAIALDNTKAKIFLGRDFESLQDSLTFVSRTI